jgi:glycosyltransferase involved in cell wall biosynthesis
MSENFPLVSVITVCKNSVDTLERCLLSVQQQQYPNIEHIILDGGSTDGSLAILDKHSNKIAFWKSEPDNGIYDAMNKAIQFAKGDWILFLGADDFLYPGFSDFCLRLKVNRRLYYGCSLWENIVQGGMYRKYDLAKKNICHQAIFYPKHIFEKYKYNTRYKVRADYVLNMQCWAEKDFDAEYIPILVSNYTPGGFSGKVKDEEFKKDRLTLTGKYLGYWPMFRYMIRRYKNKRKSIKNE